MQVVKQIEAEELALEGEREGGYAAPKFVFVDVRQVISAAQRLMKVNTDVFALLWQLTLPTLTFSSLVHCEQLLLCKIFNSMPF